MRCFSISNKKVMDVGTFPACNCNPRWNQHTADASAVMNDLTTFYHGGGPPTKTDNSTSAIIYDCSLLSQNERRPSSCDQQL